MVIRNQNPTVSLNGRIVIDGGTMQSLLNTLYLVGNRLLMGYMPQDVTDGQFNSFVLVLNGRPRGWTKKLRERVELVVQAWALGAGFGYPKITWPE